MRVLLGLTLMAGAARAQQSAPGESAAPQTGAVTAITPAAGFSIRGVVRSGSTKLPGVSVTATHSLTGRKVITSTDVDGSFRLDLPSKGRWLLRAEFSAFAAQTAEVMLIPAQPDATHDFELVLLSRVPKTTNDRGNRERRTAAGAGFSSNRARGAAAIAERG